MRLHNLIEEDVIYAIDNILKKHGEVCSCEKCRLDITAITLNNLKPKYVVTKKGLVYGKIDRLNNQCDADVVREIIKAIEIVKDNPRHDID